MKGNRERSGLTLFTGAVLILLILWIPVRHVSLPGVNDHFMMLCIWIALVYTIAMQSHRTIGYPVTLFPIFQGYMAVTGYTVMLETGFMLAIFLGTLIYQVRIGESSRELLPSSGKLMLVSLLSLRIAAFLLQQVRSEIFSSTFLTAVALAGTCSLVMFLNQFLLSLFERGGLKISLLLGKYFRSVIYPGFFVLFLLPAALQTKVPVSTVWEWNLIAGVATVLIIQTGLSLMLDRARFSYSRTIFLEDELGKHSKILTDLDSSIEALRVLASFWFTASKPEGVRVTWKNISLTCPTGFDPSEKAPLRRLGEGGLLLEVWPTARTTLDRDRVEIFILQTETVLKNLELRDSVFRSGWKCLEAMVYSLDMSDSRQAGYSRIVADISKDIGLAIGMSVAELEDLEMSAMLHLTAAILEKAEEDWLEVFSTDPTRTQFQLPPEVFNGIKHMTENWDGSGRPEGLAGKDIPLISRILAVASNFVANMTNQPLDNAVLELKRRSGMIFDPEIVEALEDVTSREESPATVH